MNNVNLSATNNVLDMFASKVFSDDVMRKRLPKDIYKSLKKTIELSKPLELDVANVVAAAMKDWAAEQGVTHYTHWFQPMTGITAEKHDSFITPISNDKIIMEFSGKELVRGEPDASSFPNGGIRSTFEARGYTVWDTTSYAFIKDDTLCIPTAFCSYSGEALDKKTPLLRSMDAVNKQALRILRLFGNTTAKRVNSTVGAEQEYFLIDKEVFSKRPDLMYCGRTLFGARPPKGQEMDDHYFGSIKPRVSAFMKDLDAELWKLGVMSKTKHNEVAPAQHEVAPVFTNTNIATDHNQLTMELMKNIADKHNLACLLHEKPFAGVNGSGKHNNWSISTDTGINLLDPGETPYDNAQFVLFLMAVIKAVDEHQDLLRISVANAGNDHRLGANEAPPAIVSMFLGDELMAVLESLENKEDYVGAEKVEMELGVDVLPHFPKDSTDRNRTSPFAFTGNKFEFRMLGSSFSVSGPNIVLNTIVADVLSGFADTLENADDFKKALGHLVRKVIREHKRIIFNGNNYSDEWVVEAEKRGLLNLKTTVEALPKFIDDKNIALFEKHKVFAKGEMHARYEIMMENYQKTIHIEALTFIELVKKEICESAFQFQKELLEILSYKKEVGIDYSLEKELTNKCSELLSLIYAQTQELEKNLIVAKDVEDVLELGLYYRNSVFNLMAKTRVMVDELETIVPNKYKTMPTYGELLYSVY